MDLLAGYSDENSKQSPKLDQTMQPSPDILKVCVPSVNRIKVKFDSKVEKGRSLEEEWASFEKLIDGDYMGETTSGKEDITSTSQQIPITKTKFSERNIEETYAFEIQSGSSSGSTSRSNSVEPGKSAESDKVKLETVTVDSKDDVVEILPSQYRPRKTPFQDSGKGSSTSRSRSRSRSPKRHRKSIDKRSRSRSKDRHRSRKSKKEKSRHRSSSRHKSPNSKRSRSPKRSRSRSKDQKHTRDRKSSRERHRHRSKDRSHRKKHNSPRRHRSKSRSPRKHRSKSRSPRKHKSTSKSPRRHRSKSRSPRRHKSKSRSPRRHRSKSRSPRRHRSRSRSPWRHRSRSPRRHRRSSYSRSRSRSYSPRSYKSVPVNSYQQKIMGTLAKKSKPLTFREKMRQDLLKASKMLTDQATNGTLMDDSDKVGDVYSRIVGTSESGPVTPQMALLQTMAAMHQKAQELTGVTVPRYYNPAAVNPLKYAEQFQKRKLLWSKNKEKKEEKTGDQWQGTSFSSDNDGKMGAKFRKLMGMKEDAAITDDALTEEQKVKREDFFARLDQDYEFARMSTHTHRGVGLGFASQGMSMPQFPQP